MLWKFVGSNFSVLAAVHVMDDDRFDPATAIEQAYSQANRVVFESDLNAVPDPALLTLPDGDRLERLIPEPSWSMMQQAWVEAGLPPDNLARLQPWVAAITFQMAYSGRLSITAAAGVDRHFWNRCTADRKARGTLETQADALRTFSAIPLDEQLRMLSLFADARHTSHEIASMVRAWRENDEAIFQAIMQQRLTMCPVGFSALLGGRNRAWLPELLRMAGDGVPTLAVVGALHCFGPDGLPALLTRAGLAAVPVGATLC